MKFLKRTFVILMALALCLSPILSPALTAQADGPTTYYVKYQPDSNEWLYQLSSTWDNGAVAYDLKYLNDGIKDGDLLIIDGQKELTFSVNANLDNLTIVHSIGAVISAKSIKNFYIINDSVGVINGDVTNAYIYDSSLCNFNSNVTNLELLSEKNVNLAATVQVAGTVNHLKASGKEFTHFEFYNFAKNSLLIEAGHLKTDPSKFSDTPSAATVTTPAPQPSAPTPSSPAGEYDDVPKTGGFSVNPLWFIGIAVLFFAGQYKLNKR